MLTGATIEAATLGASDGDDILIIADEVLVARGGSRDFTGITVQSGTSSQRNSGNAGQLRIVAGQLEVQDGGRIIASTFGTGRGGRLEVEAQHITLSGASPGSDPGGLFAEAKKGSSGAAGTLLIEAGELEVRNGAIISTTTSGPGSGGDLRVVAEQILMDGQGRVGKLSLMGDAVITDGFTGLYTLSTSENGGAAGSLNITTGQLEVRNGAAINANTFGGGAAGAMVIVAEQVLIDHAQVVTESVSGQNAGDAGNISLTARQLELRNQSLIGTGAVQAGGGTIALYVGERVRLSQSVVSTAVRGGAGDAGNIIIGLATENTGEQLLNSQFIILNDSVVRANAFGGDGGNINIAAQVFLASPASILSASSALGNPGQIDVRSPVTDIRGTFAPLPEGFLAADALLHKRCAERVGGAAPSSFVVRGGMACPSVLRACYPVARR